MLVAARASVLASSSRVRLASSLISIPAARYSRASSSLTHPYINLSRSTLSAIDKGKGRALHDYTSSPLEFMITSRDVINRRQSRYFSRKCICLVSAHPSSPSAYNAIWTRSFHSSARRDAIPLLPVGLVFFKSTSILAIITTISRILISFFPLGTIAAFKSVRGVRWLSDDSQTPNAGPEAEEFWRMWCNGERAIKPTRDDSRLLLASELDADGAITLSDGRRAWAYPVNPRTSRPGWKKYLNPQVLREDPEGEFKGIKERMKTNLIMSMRFFLPALPTSSIPYFDRMDPATQAEVIELRRYWVTLHAFKDQLFWARLVVFALFLLPCLLLTGVYICALERVPFTGRWRIILLTAEDEDKISSSLAGANWYRSVINLLTTPEAPAPPVLPLSDWRWRWVEGVLRTLEQGVVAAAAAHEAGLEDDWEGPDGPATLRPPPSKYPLKPRPRVSSRLHSALPGGDPHSGKEHLELGPPFSLMLMEKDERNAFSYGFGGKGAGGVVVFTGLLDDILSQDQMTEENLPPAETSKKTGLFGGLFSSPAPARQPPRPIQPTEEQTLHLASVLAHEMGHLLLSHHLETLSQQQVLWPSLLGLSMDLIRAFIWPFTIFLGPAVNDALANMGRTTTEELVDRYGEIGFQWKHEYEADLVGMRILARAGYDTQRAVTHFAKSISHLHEIQPLDRDTSESWTGSLFKLWTRATHPSSESRLAGIEKELESWAEAQSG